MTAHASVSAGSGLPVERWEAVRSALTAAVRRTCPPWLAADAEDIVQESMVRLLGILKSREGKPDPGSSYLWRVAHSVTVDEIRRRRRRREVPMEEGLLEAGEEGGGASPEGLAEAAEVGRGILDCLTALARDRRRAVSLRLLGHTVGEVATLLEWSYKRAENLVYRGLADLRRCLRRKDLQP
ncbi:MAG TPA: sigma-70 family RNA polymerase sigma factor [Acidobacteria bacterium]|nr:sigma-70 family RNA polymerase sigma factor [Acidobacteriota bacterium]